MILIDDELSTEGLDARRQLAKRLLDENCAGKAGLDEDDRAELRKIAAATPPSPH